MSKLELALEYMNDEWAVLPLRPDKTPYLPEGEHKKYLYQAATEAEVRSFWKRFPDAQVGLACGKVSGRTVVDIDEGVDVFPDTKTVLTPTGGKHKIYRYSPKIENSVGSYFKGIDTRNDGGYIVAAGSHCVYTKKGRKIEGDYKVIDDLPSRVFPEELFESKRVNGGKFDPQKLLGAPDGERNASAASVIGLLVQGKSREIQVPLWELTKSWNSKNNPPLDERELLAVFNSITEREWSKKEKETQLIDGLKIQKESRDYVVEIPLPNAKVFIRFAEVQRSRQSFEAVVAVQLVHEKEGKMPAFEQRLDLNSASAVSNLCTSLNAAYGNKKDGYNWVLILNRAGMAMKKLIGAEKKPVVFSKQAKFEPVTYLIEHFLEVGSPTLIHGDGSTGKSYLTLYMVVCAALGMPVFGKRTEYFKTLYLDHEATALKLQNRLHRVANGLGVPFEALVDHIHWYKPDGSLANEQEIIAKMVEEGGYKCIIVDAGASASGGSPMDEQAVLKLFTALDHIPCAKLIIHHEPKDASGSDDKAYYGTTFWRNAPRLVWRLKRESKEDTTSVIRASHHKANDDGESAPIVYSMAFPKDEVKVLFEQIDDFEPSDESKILEYLVQGEADMEAISAAVGLPRNSAERRVDDLIRDEKIERKREGRKYVYFIPKRF